MSFDPYYKWLAIPPEEQPPHDYRLLGLRLFENDPEVIANAAERQAMLLRTVQMGQHQAESQRLMNEVAAARLRLLDPRKKAVYDHQLRARLATAAATPSPASPATTPNASAPLQPSPAQRSPVQPAPFPSALFQPASPITPIIQPAPADSVAPIFPAPVVTAAPAKPASGASSPKKRPWWVPATIAAAALVMLAAGGVAMLAGGDQEEVSQATNPPPPTTPSTAPQPDRPPNAAPGTTTEIAAPSQPASSTPAVSHTPPLNAVVVSTSANPPGAPPQTPPRSPSPPTIQVSEATPAPANSAPPSSSTAASSSTAPAPGNPPPAPATVTEAPAKPQKLTPPEGADLEKARQEVREIFAAQYQETQTPQQRLELAKTLFDQAEQVSGDPRGKYALLLEAFEQTIEVGYYPTSLKIVEELSDHWEVDRLRLLGRALAAAVRSPHMATMREGLIDAALDLAEEAVQARRYDGADSVASIADNLATKVREVELRKKTREMLDRTRRLRRDWERVTAARQTLEADPNDPAANLAVGTHLCLEEGDFEQGLPHLAKGSNAELQALAQRDLAEQEKAIKERVEDAVALADAWNAFAGSDDEYAGFVVRAHAWYSQAAPHAAGLVKTKVELRLKELAENEAIKRRGLPNVASVAAYQGPVEIQVTPLTTLVGHTDQVRRVAFAPRGMLLATGSNDNTAKVWDLEKRRLLFTLAGHNHNVPALAWTPDGKSLATGSEDKTIRIWDVLKGRLLRAIAAHPGTQGVRDVAFAPNGRLLISCGASDNAVRLWDARTGAAAGGFASPSRMVYDVEITRDGRAITGGGGSGGADGAHVWDAEGKIVYTFPFNYYVRFASPSPDGKLVVVGGTAYSAHVWSLENGQQVRQLSTAHGECAAWSSDGKIVAIGGGGADIQFYDTATWEVRRTVSVPSAITASLSFSADGKLLATCGSDAIVRLWSVEITPRPSARAVASGTGAGSAPPGPPAAPTPTTGAATTPGAVAGANSGGAVASVDSGASAPSPAPANAPRLGNGPAMLRFSTRPHRTADQQVKSIRSIAATLDGLTIATGGDDHLIHLRAVEPAGRSHTLGVHSSPVTAIAFNHTGEIVASADETGKVRCSQFTPFKTLGSWDQAAPVRSLHFLRDGSLLVAGGDGAIEQRNAETGAATFDFRGHTDAVTGLAIRPDESELISAGTDGKLIVWNLANRSVAGRILRDEASPIDELALAPQGDQAAALLSSANRVILYHFITRKAVNIDVSGRGITSIAFLPSGDLLLGGSNGTVTVFTTERLQRNLVKAFPDAAVQHLAVSPGGQWLATASTDELRVWTLPLE